MNVNTKPIRADVEELILSKTFTRLPSGTAIVCEITLRNLHVVHGISCVVDMDNYDEAVGKQVAESKAIEKVFDIVAYGMHSLINDGIIQSSHYDLRALYQDKFPQPNLV